MRLQPDEDALGFAATVRELLADVAGSAALRLAWDSPDGRIPGLWQRLGELGVTGAVIPETYGGLGLDARSLLPVLVESGRAALPEPLVETVVGASVLAAAGGELATRWLPAVAEGAAAIGTALGPGHLASAAQWADLLILRADTGRVHAVATADVDVHPCESIDAGVRLATIDWTPSPATELDADATAAFDLGVVGAAAQLIGLSDAMLDRSVQYAQQREQFGKVIGSFQAVKHQLADAYVATAFAKPVVSRAAWSLATGAATRTRDASHAKFAAGRAAAGSARTALQVHAGIGYTFEHDLHMWLKRRLTLGSLWGDGAWHRTSVADFILDD
jgi:alkylation response protein AidB-like acyl-CoA dehydrogenase